MEMRFAGNLADTIRVEGGGLHIQRGGSGANITQVGGTVNVSGSGNARSYVSGLYVQGGTCTLTTLADLENVQVTAGLLKISAVTVKDLSVTGAGSFTLYAGHAISGSVNFAAGALTNDADAYAENGVIYNLDLAVAGSFGSGVTLSSATLDTVTNMYAGAVGRNVKLVGDTTRRYNINSGVSAYDTIINGGSAQMIAATGGGYMSGVTVSGGVLLVRYAGNVAENVNLYSNDFYIQSGASARNVTVYGGTLRCQSGSLTGGTISGGTVS